ncbi:MAG: HipA domain-containing protein, partial [Alphaproteobacteria bacterium]
MGCEDILSHLDKHPMLAGEEGIRMSGAGAQDKLMIAFVGNNIASPTENTPSTHIIKPQIKGIEFSVQNEFFCMRLAKKVGLSVPEARIFSL